MAHIKAGGQVVRGRRIRQTRSPRQAVERVLDVFPLPRPEIPRKPVRELAFLLDLLKRQHTDRQKVQAAVPWYGQVPGRGLSGWEEGALEWGRTDVTKEPKT